MDKNMISMHTEHASKPDSKKHIGVHIRGVTRSISLFRQAVAFSFLLFETHGPIPLIEKLQMIFELPLLAVINLPTLNLITIKKVTGRI